MKLVAYTRSYVVGRFTLQVVRLVEGDLCIDRIDADKGYPSIGHQSYVKHALISQEDSRHVNKGINVVESSRGLRDAREMMYSGGRPIQTVLFLKN